MGWQEKLKEQIYWPLLGNGFTTAFYSCMMALDQVDVTVCTVGYRNASPGTGELPGPATSVSGAKGPDAMISQLLAKIQCTEETIADLSGSLRKHESEWQRVFDHVAREIGRLQILIDSEPRVDTHEHSKIVPIKTFREPRTPTLTCPGQTCPGYTCPGYQALGYECEPRITRLQLLEIEQNREIRIFDWVQEEYAKSPRRQELIREHDAASLQLAELKALLQETINRKKYIEP
jgi:hypothetical protein